MTELFPRDMWMEPVLKLSTVHLRQDTAAALAQNGYTVETLSVVSVDQGYMVYVTADESNIDHVQEQGAGELAHILRRAYAENYSWIWFDADAATNPLLPTWAWEA